MARNVVAETISKLGLKQKPKEKRQVFLRRIIRTIYDFPQNKWGALPKEVMIFFNNGARAINEGRDVPDFEMQQEKVNMSEGTEMNVQELEVGQIVYLEVGEDEYEGEIANVSRVSVTLETDDGEVTLQKRKIDYAELIEEAEEEEPEEDEEEEEPEEEEEEKPVTRRGRGRPRKAAVEEEPEEEEEKPVTRRGRGRPRKSVEEEEKPVTRRGRGRPRKSVEEEEEKPVTSRRRGRPPAGAKSITATITEAVIDNSEKSDEKIFAIVRKKLGEEPNQSTFNLVSKTVRSILDKLRERDMLVED